MVKWPLFNPRAHIWATSTNLQLEVHTMKKFILPVLLAHLTIIGSIAIFYYFGVGTLITITLTPILEILP